MARACPHCGARHPSSLTRCPATGLPVGGDPGLVGTTIAGRYHLVRLLGDGGMGAVYKAADQVLRRFVAIKLLHPAVAKNPSAVERFQREARAAATIGHPNIIDILDFGLEEKRPYMVMEYLRGRSLSQIIASEGSLGIKRAGVIAAHTLAGLAVAHDRGILHRDLKPANLMLVARFGDRNFVKVCDFGFAALFGGSTSGNDDKVLTPERTLVGTPAYAAPERLRGDDRRDPRTDVYSVGVVLFEMLAGQRPFDAPTFAELARKVRNEPPPSLRELRPDAPPGLDKVIARALAKKTEDRWASAEEFAAALVPFGGRNIRIDDDAPSDSFTFEMMRLRARESRRRNTRPSIELPKDEFEAIRAMRRKPAVEVPGDERQDVRAAPAARVPSSNAPAEVRRSGSVEIPIDVDPLEDGPDDDPRSTQRREVPARSARRRSSAPATDATIRTAALSDQASSTVRGEMLRGSSATSRPATEPAPSPAVGSRGAAAAADRALSDTSTELGAGSAESAIPLSRKKNIDTPVKISGRIVVSVLRFVARKYGERALQDLLAALPPGPREPFRAGIDPDAFSNFSDLRTLVEAIDARLGEDDLHMVLECGRAAAEGAFELMRKLRPPSPPPELLLAEMPTVLQSLCQGMELEVRRLGKGYGRLELVEHETPSLTTSVLMLGFLERSLERFGAEDVEVNLLGARALEDPQTLVDISWLG